MSKPRPPDRFEKALTKIYRAEGLSDEEVPAEYWEILKLLRREHAATVRAVKTLQRWKFATLKAGTMEACMTTEPDDDWIELTDILAALDKRRR